MIDSAALCLWIVFGAATALAQVPVSTPPAGSPKFDVASVKVIDRSTLTGRGGGGRGVTGGPGTSDPGRYSDPVDTMLGLLFKAFGVGSGQVIGQAVQPRVGASLYEVMATMPSDTTKEQFQAMLQNLLIERFHLVVHHETRNFPGYELVIDKGGPKLKEAIAQSDDGPKPTNSRSNFQNVSAGNITMKEKTIEDLAMRLGMALWTAQVIQTQDVNLPQPRVVDKTGLTGKYTFSLDFTPPGFMLSPNSPAADLPDLFVALREKLGLRLNKTEGVPIDVIVVDSVDNIPAAN